MKQLIKSFAHISRNRITLLIILFSLGLFSFSLKSYFWSDDWYFLSVVQNARATDIISFFSFFQTQFSTPMYRPLSSQVFYYTFYSLFGLNAVPYFLFGLALFGWSLWLVYIVTIKIFRSKSIGITTLFFYAFSSTHIYRLNFIASYQEIMMVVCVLLTILWFLDDSPKSFWKMTGIYMCALCCRENAIMTVPLIILICLTLKKPFKRWHIFILSAISFMYLIFRFSGPHVIFHDSGYVFNFSFLETIHTAGWYFFWSLGAPETTEWNILGYYFAPSILSAPHLIQLFFVGIMLFLFIVSALFVYKIWRKRTVRLIYFSVFWFVVGMLPVLFLPGHKFVIEQTLGLIGVCFLLGVLFDGAPKRITYMCFCLYVCINVFSMESTYRYHYMFHRMETVQKVVSWVKKTYPASPSAPFLFVNSNRTNMYVDDVRFLSDSLLGSYFFKVLYHDPQFHVYYEGDQNSQDIPHDVITVDVRQLIR